MNTIQDQLTAAEAANKAGNFAEAEAICRKCLLENISREQEGIVSLHLSESLFRRGQSKEGFSYAQNAAEIFEQLKRPSQQGQAVMGIGTSFYLQGNFEQALHHYKIGLALYEDANEQKGISRALGNIGIVYLATSDYPQSLEYQQKALDIDVAINDEDGIAMRYGNIGMIYSEVAEYSKALDYQYKALQLHEKLGRKDFQINNLGNIANIYLHLENYPRCIEFNRKVLELSYICGRQDALIAGLANLATVYTLLKDKVIALEYYQKSMALAQEYNKQDNIAMILLSMGRLYFDVGEYCTAEEYYKQALELNTQLGRKSGVARSLASLAKTYSTKAFQAYSPSTAEELWLKALSVAQEVHERKEQKEYHKSLADLYHEQKKWKKSDYHFRKFYMLEQTIFTEQVKKQADKFAYERQIAVMEKEREVTDMLLHKFLPSPIINEVKAKEGKILVQQFNSISVLFADLVGFTKLSLSIKPEIMIEMLNFIFTKFDTIIKEAGGHRLKTIGDGYFAICGAPDLVENHQYKLAKAALKFMEDIILPKHIKQKLPEGTVLDIRIGLHCGEAVCGMVGGLEKWQYDAYGDTINTASRMESHGEAGKIHISEDFKNSLLDYDEFRFISREPMTIKGKGLMNTYFLQ